MESNIVSGLDVNAAVIRNGVITVAPGLNQTMTGNSTVKPTTPEGMGRSGRMRNSMY